MHFSLQKREESMHIALCFENRSLINSFDKVNEDGDLELLAIILLFKLLFRIKCGLVMLKLDEVLRLLSLRRYPLPL